MDHAADAQRTDLMTITRFVLNEQSKYPESRGDFTILLSHIVLGCKFVCSAVNKVFFFPSTLFYFVLLFRYCFSLLFIVFDHFFDEGVFVFLWGLKGYDKNSCFPVWWSEFIQLVVRDWAMLELANLICNKGRPKMWGSFQFKYFKGKLQNIWLEIREVFKG